MNKQGKNRVLYYTAAVIGGLIYIALAVFMSVMVIKLVSKNGVYPSGSDTMYHIYRGDYVYNSIKAGNWYPLYDYMWYNGVELTGHHSAHMLWHSVKCLPEGICL